MFFARLGQKLKTQKENKNTKHITHYYLPFTRHQRRRIKLNLVGQIQDTAGGSFRWKLD
jgi:hypothetical protein